MHTFAIVCAVLALAFSNGANDNFKGVATLLGSGAATYRTALLLATGATLLGSLTAVILAEWLLKNFSGRVKSRRAEIVGYNGRTDITPICHGGAACRPGSVLRFIAKTAWFMLTTSLAPSNWAASSTHAKCCSAASRAKALTGW